MSTLMNRLINVKSFCKDIKKFEEVCTKIYYFHLNRDDDELLEHSLIKTSDVNHSKRPNEFYKDMYEVYKSIN